MITQSIVRDPSHLSPNRLRRFSQTAANGRAMSCARRYTTSRTRRVRFSNEPPYRSCRLIAEWREKLVKQIAMRSMNFHDTKPRIAGATRCLAQMPSPLPNPILGESLRDSVPLRERQGAWARLPEASPPRASGISPRPSHGRNVLALRPACASWIAGHTTLFMDKASDALERLNVVVAPDPEILRANAPFRQDRRRFRKAPGPHRRLRGYRGARSATRWQSRSHWNTGTSARRRFDSGTSRRKE